MDSPETARPQRCAQPNHFSTFPPLFTDAVLGPVAQCGGSQRRVEREIGRQNAKTPKEGSKEKKDWGSRLVTDRVSEKSESRNHCTPRSSDSSVGAPSAPDGRIND